MPYPPRVPGASAMMRRTRAHQQSVAAGAAAWSATQSDDDRTLKDYAHPIRRPGRATVRDVDGVLRLRDCRQLFSARELRAWRAPLHIALHTGELAEGRVPTGLTGQGRAAAGQGLGPVHSRVVGSAERAMLRFG